jgi:uncharacterized membrane protein
MKKLILALSFMSFLMSCQKSPVDKKTIQKDYFYRLNTVDMDLQSSLSQISVVKVGVQVPVGDQTSYKLSNLILPISMTELYEKPTKNWCKDHCDDERCKVMPITLEYFTVDLENSQVYVTWKTLMEINVKYFEVQRSDDGKNFYTVAIVFPKGPEVYKIKDTYKMN